MKIEAATISDIQLSPDYPYVRIFYFKDRKYRVVMASTKNYEVGEEVLFIPGDARLPEWLLRFLGFWDEKNDCGLLGGKEHDVVCPFNYAGNSNYFSYGTFVRIENNEIMLPTGEVAQLHDKDLEEKLGITYLASGAPYYFLGDFFFMDVPVNRHDIQDLEVNYTDFMSDSEVYYEEFVAGKRFYLTLDTTSMHHNALGPDHNIYVTSSLFRKYMFLSRTKKNYRGNLFVKMVTKHMIPEDLTNYIKTTRIADKITLELIVRNTAFGNNEQILNPDKSLLVVTDVFLGTVPWGRYMNRDEKKKFCKSLGLSEPEELAIGPFDYQEAEHKVAGGLQGVIIRTYDNNKRAVLYSRKQRLLRKHKLH